MNFELNKTYCIDNREGMKLLPNNYVDLTITSPPYDDIRSYKGCEWNFDIFKDVAQELYRVTKDGGVVVWVVNDKTVKGSESGTSFRQALYFKEIGFNLHDTMIYAKTNYIPLTHNRYEQGFEYMFVLSKGKVKTFNGLREQSKYAGTNNSSGTVRKMCKLNNRNYIGFEIAEEYVEIDNERNK